MQGLTNSTKVAGFRLAFHPECQRLPIRCLRATLEQTELPVQDRKTGYPRQSVDIQSSPFDR